MKTRLNTCVYAWLFITILMAWMIPAFAQPIKPAAQAGGAASQSGKNTAVITGEWQGVIARQHLIVRIEQPPEGPLQGTLIVPDQGNISVPIDAVSFDQSGVLHLDLQRAGATYEGKLSADGAEINGTWQQGGNSVALLLHRPGATAGKSTLKPRTQGRIALEPCRTSDGNMEALCGKYEVYENRQSQTGRKIALNIMLLQSMADKPEPDPFFALAGGPGQSATEAFPPTGFVTQVRRLRDVVLVDQRGTGNSNPLPCSLQNLQDAQAVLGEPYSLEKITECRRSDPIHDLHCRR